MRLGIVQKNMRILAGFHHSEESYTMRTIKAIEPLDGYRLKLRLDNDVEVIADVSHLVGKGVFTPQRDARVFEQVSINEESGTVTWPSDLDLDPDVLYARVTNEWPAWASTVNK